MANYSTTFTQGNGALGDSWESKASNYFNNSSAVIVVASNQASCNSPTAFRAVFRPETFTDVLLEIELKSQTGAGGACLCARVNSTGTNGYFFAYETSTYDGIYKVVSGVSTKLVGGISIDPSAGEFLQFSLVGTTLTAKILDASRAEIASITITDSTYTSGQMGFGVDFANVTLDNFALTEVAPDTTPTITTASVPAGTVGVAYDQTLAVSSGDGAIAWSKQSGALPPGITFNTSTHKFEGTPTTAGTYGSIVIRATDVDGDYDEETYSIVISAVDTNPVITTTTLPNGTVGTAYSQTPSRTGGESPFTWTVQSGSLPTGLSLNSSTGAITGTPSAAGTFNFTLRVTDTDGDYDDQSYTVVISEEGEPDPIIPVSSLVEFDESEVPRLLVLAGIQGGPTFNTEISGNALGIQQRNINRLAIVHRYAFDFGASTGSMRELRQFFVAGYGRAYGFRLWEPNFVWDNEQIGTSVNAQTVYKLYKNFTGRGRTVRHRILKPVPNLVVKLDGATVSYTVDYARGLITFGSNPGAGNPITITGEYCIPVYFETDDYDAKTETTYEDINLPMIEIPADAFGFD